MINNFNDKQNIKSKLVYKNVDINSTFDFCVSIPTYNRYELLKETINSITRQINFNLNRLCVVVCDNNVEDNEEKKEFLNWISNLSISVFYYVHEKNLGMFGNWNRCFELSKSENTIFIHDDDFLCENYFCVIDSIISKKNDIDILIPLQYNMSNNEICYTNTNKILSGKIYKYPLIFNYLTGTMAYGTSGCYFKKSAVLKTAGFSIEKYWPISDWLFYLENYESLNIYKLHSKLFVYRMEVNIGRNPQAVLKEVEIGEHVFKEIFKNKVYFKMLNKFIYNGQVMWYANIAKKILLENNDYENAGYLDEKYNLDNSFSFVVFNTIRKISLFIYKLYILITMKKV
ncbi:MAG: glycosyltransferase family 2 protein [Erysipelotrichaceae bacterium]|nr:glycosyltransferase family 2 protein [Erysipelotrichaceae bacterium]